MNTPQGNTLIKPLFPSANIGDMALCTSCMAVVKPLKELTAQAKTHSGQPLLAVIASLRVATMA